jgi:hypothetical protein
MTPTRPAQRAGPSVGDAMGGHHTETDGVSFGRCVRSNSRCADGDKILRIAGAK